MKKLLSSSFDFSMYTFLGLPILCPLLTLSLKDGSIPGLP
jgi:hypothetical protein